MIKLTTQQPETFLERAGEIKRIAVFRALMLGDLLCTVPAWRALRAAYPQAEITLIGLPWAKSFVRRFNHLLDDFVEFPGLPGLPEIEPNLMHFPRFIEEMQNRRFDLAIQMQGSGSIVNPLVELFGARYTAGFYTTDSYCPNPATFMLYPADEHESTRFLRLMQFLGVQEQGEHSEFPLFEQDYTEFSAIAERHGLQPGKYICLHAGARFASRRWLPERTAAVADELAGEGWQTVLTGTADELGVVTAVKNKMRIGAIDLCGQTSLGALGALLKQSALLITNDTGVSHVAAALRVPSVVIFLSADGTRWLPKNSRVNRALLHPVECRPCGQETCPIQFPVYFPCANGVTAANVLLEARELLYGKSEDQ